jgi:5'-3' exonuclease
VGDTIDNLPGVPGIGAKSAAAILQAFGTIEEVPADFARWDGVTVRGAKRMAELVALHRERALKTKDLATVLREVPGIKPGLTELAYRGADRERTEELFERLGWNRIFDRIPKWQN